MKKEKILYRSERSTREIMEGRTNISETEGSGQINNALIKIGMKNGIHIHIYIYIVMRRIPTFRSTSDRIYDGGPIIFYYNIL